MRALASILPFAETDTAPLDMLHSSGIELVRNPVEHRMTEADLISAVGDVDAIICGTEPITARVIAAAPRLKVVARVGSGYDTVDIAAAQAHGVKVTITPDGPVESVAELTIALALDACRNISRSDRSIRDGKWIRPMGRLLAERTVGVAGVSRIGVRVAQKLLSLGCRVIGHDLRPRDDLPITFVNKAELLEQSDILTLHLAATPQTKDWLGATEFAMMRKGSILVNASRGGIVDETALHDALSSGHLAHAAIDVFGQEPYSGPLAELPNVTLSAHIGSMTLEARTKMEFDACQSVVDVLAGRAPAYCVN